MDQATDLIMDSLLSETPFVLVSSASQTSASAPKSVSLADLLSPETVAAAEDAGVVQRFVADLARETPTEGRPNMRAIFHFMRSHNMPVDEVLGNYREIGIIGLRPRNLLDVVALYDLFKVHEHAAHRVNLRTAVEAARISGR